MATDWSAVQDMLDLAQKEQWTEAEIEYVAAVQRATLPPEFKGFIDDDGHLEGPES